MESRSIPGTGSLAPSPSSHKRSPLDPRFHLAAIIDSFDDPIISKGLDGIIVSWNEAATRVFGYEAEEMIGQSILRLIPPELQHEEQEIIRQLKAGQRIDHFETVRLRKNGERVHVSVTISPVRDDQGRIIGASKIAHEITERRKLDEIRARLAAIVDYADDAIISKDLNGIVTSWNEGARRMYGYTADEMIGQPILRLIPEDLHYEEDAILRKLHAGERIDHYETARITKSGRRLEVSVTISPLRDSSGRIIGVSKIARDISSRKVIERLLLQSEKLAATGRMAASIAHEINNPLESLMNLVYLARQNCPPESKSSELLLTAERELERVAHIARQTLGYYRDTGKPIDAYLHELIENVLAVYNPKLISAGISVHCRFEDTEKITIRKGEMLQIYSNLIANAIDAMRDGGSLHICTRMLPHTIETVIRDTGHGIAADHLPNVFEPFFTTKGDLGTGIGLWVSRELVTSRGGKISIASSTEKRNSGTSVTVSIPFALPPAHAAESHSKATGPQGLKYV